MDRTFAATAKRLKDVRREGRVAKSSELVAAGCALVAIVVLYFVGAKIVLVLANQLKGSLTEAGGSSISVSIVTGRLTEVFVLVAAAVVPALVLIALSPVLMHWLQFGFLFVPWLVQPRAGRLFSGRRSTGLASPTAWVRGALGVVRLVVIGSVVGGYLYNELPALVGLMSASVPALAVQVGRMVIRFGVMLSLLLLVPAGFDFLLARWQFNRELRMTAAEVREEQRTAGRD